MNINSNQTYLLKLIGLILVFSPKVLAGSVQPDQLPLLEIGQLHYQGVFIIPAGEYGESSADNTTGQMEYNPVNHSLFFAGKFTQGAVGKFTISALVNSTNVSDLHTGAVL